MALNEQGGGGPRRNPLGPSCNTFASFGSHEEKGSLLFEGHHRGLGVSG